MYSVGGRVKRGSSSPYFSGNSLSQRLLFKRNEMRGGGKQNFCTLGGKQILGGRKLCCASCAVSGLVMKNVKNNNILSFKFASLLCCSHRQILDRIGYQGMGMSVAFKFVWEPRRNCSVYKSELVAKCNLYTQISYVRLNSRNCLCKGCFN